METLTNFTEAEYEFCMYKLNLQGSFLTSFIDTVFKADVINQAKLSMAFPELVAVIIKYKTESGYWDDLVNRWNEIYPTRKLYY